MSSSPEPKKTLRMEERSKGTLGQQKNMFENNSNPFTNDVVLKRLFQVCEVSELSRFRLVSSQWYSLSLPRYRKDSTLKIHQPNLRNRKINPLSLPQWKSLSDEVHPGEQQFKTFSLRDFQFCSSPIQFYDRKFRVTQLPELEQVYKNMSNFFPLYGQWIYKLELVKSTIYSVDAFKKAIFECTPVLHELKLVELTIDDRNPPEDDESEEDVKIQGKTQRNMRSLSVANMILPVSWRQLFLQFPNVKCLELKQLGMSDEIDTIIDTLEELSRITTTSDLVTIEEFFLHETACDESSMMKLFQLPNLKLSKLRVDLWHDSDTDDEAIKASILATALRIHRSTLNDLFVNYLNEGPSREEDPYESFPFQEEPFEFITTLTLDSFVGGCLSFLRIFPNLKILRLQDMGTDKMLRKTDLAKLGNVRLPHVKELKFTMGPFWEYYISGEVMEILVKIMPNVEFFVGPLATPTLRVVCRTWKNLKKLDLVDAKGKIDNDALTGILPDAEEGARLPNITDLKYLESLKILQLGNGRIDDNSVWNAFLKMSHLHTLDVVVSFKTTDDSFRVLKERFPGGNISRRLSPEEKRAQEEAREDSESDFELDSDSDY